MALENYQLIESVNNIKDFMKDVMENMITGIITINRDMQVTYINRNAQFMLNISGSEILNKHYKEILSLDIICIFDHIIDEVQEAGSVIDYEFEQKISGETVFPLGASASLLRNKELNKRFNDRSTCSFV